MAILESSEIYVETIYILSLESDTVRAKDISNYLEVTRPSVSSALNVLRDKGLIKNTGNGIIQLTEGGIILAKHIYERKLLITRHFIELGVDEDTAKDDARRIERFLSDTTFNAIRASLIRKGA
jgi:Mn-dependent DtxR family transcriptional regulator